MAKLKEVLAEAADEVGIHYEGTLKQDPDTPEVTRSIEGDYLFTWITVTGEYVRITLKDMAIGAKEFESWMTVQHKNDESAQVRTILSSKHWNIRSNSSTNTMLTALKRWKTPISWHEYLTFVSDHLENNFETGDPFVWLDEVEDPGPVSYLLEPLVQDKEHNTIAAKGGSLKSMTALAALLSVATGREILPGMTPESTPQRGLYLDYETNAATHKRRLAGLARAKGIDIPTHMLGYKRLTSPLVQVKSEINRLIKAQRFDFVVVDAAGRATGGETVGEAEVQAYYNACAAFGVTILTIAHPNKLGKGIAGNDQWRNQTRNLWLLEAAKEAGSNAVILGLHHEKVNEGDLKPSLAYAVTFRGTDVSFAKAGQSDLTALENMDVPAQVVNFLTDMPNSLVKTIADDLGKTTNRISNILTSLADKGVVRSDGRKRDARWSVTHPVINGSVEGGGGITPKGLSPPPNPISAEEEETSQRSYSLPYKDGEEQDLEF